MSTGSEDDFIKLKESGLPIIWVLGGPGSGKGTQCDKIVAKYGFAHISTGDLLRDEVKKGSERGKELQTIMTEGKLVPMSVVLDLLKQAMIAAMNEKKNGFLIDGYPREKDQALAFEKEIAPVSVIIYFECKEETLRERLLNRGKTSGRADDNEETIKQRIKTFLENNALILETFPNKLKSLNAERQVDDIFKDVETIIDGTINKS